MNALKPVPTISEDVTSLFEAGTLQPIRQRRLQADATTAYSYSVDPEWMYSSDLDATGLAKQDRSNEARSGWQAIIDNWLIEWGRNPQELEDDYVIPPSFAVIKDACKVAKSMRNKGFPVPLRVVPNGEGGVVFEWWAGPIFQTIEISCNGTLEAVTYENSRLVAREELVSLRL